MDKLSNSSARIGMLVVMAILSLSNGCAGDADPKPADATTTPLWKQLRDVGREKRLYFTVEQMAISAVLTKEVAVVNAEKLQVGEWIAGMSAQLPDMQIVKSEQAANVFHLIDARLKNRQLGVAIDPMSYKGVISGLIDVIKPNVPGLDRKNGWMSGSQIDRMSDPGTIIELKTDQPMIIRDVMTIAVPREKWFPILWVATYSEQGGAGAMILNFNGPDSGKGRKN